MAGSSNAKKSAGCSASFNPLWEEAFFFVEHKGAAVCLVCHKQMKQLKKYNIQRHYTGSHSKDYVHLSPEERVEEIETLKAALIVADEKSEDEVSYLSKNTV